MEQWALQYGAQKADGVQLYTDDDKDYQLITNSPISAGSTVLYVPADLVLNSDMVAAEFGGYITAAEEALIQADSGTAQRLPLFRLFVKILAEYEKFEESLFYPWLNSLPRQFYNGVAMTGEYHSDPKIVRLIFVRCTRVRKLTYHMSLAHISLCVCSNSV